MKKPYLHNAVTDSTFTAAANRCHQVARRFRSFLHLRRMRRFYAQFIQPGDLAFDVGANVGSRTRVFLQLGAHVVAVEPQKEYARALFLSFFNNPDFHLVSKALGAAEGRAEMFVHESSLATSLSKSMIDDVARSRSETHFQAERWFETRTVGLTTLDALIAEHDLPSFVKIDVEGFEYEVMRGLSRPLSALSLEFLPVHLEPALQSIDYLQRFGPMRLNYVIEERFEWMLDRWVTPEELIPILKRYQSKTDFLYGDVYVRFGA